MAVLLLAEVNDGELAMDATAKAVTAAQKLGDVTVLACGGSAAAAGVTAVAAAAAAALAAAAAPSCPGHQPSVAGPPFVAPFEKLPSAALPWPGRWPAAQWRISPWPAPPRAAGPPRRRAQTPNTASCSMDNLLECFGYQSYSLNEERDPMRNGALAKPNERH